MRLLFAGLAALAFIIFRKKSFLDSMQWDIVGIDLKGNSLVIQIAIANPSAVPATLNKLNATVLTENNKKIADVIYSGNQEIKPETTTIMEFEVNGFTWGVLDFIANYLKGSGVVKMQGEIMFENIPAAFPLNLIYDLKTNTVKW